MRFAVWVAVIAALGAVVAQAQDGLAEAETQYQQAVALLEAEGDEPGALALFEESCARDYAAGCYRAGELLALLSESDAEDERSFNLLMRGCDLGDGLACRSAADELSFADGEDVAALATFAKGCALDDAISCRSAGLMHHTGQGVERHDFVIARQFYDRACTLGDPAGCHAAGVTVISEQGLPGYPLARSFFERGLAIDPDHPDSKLALEQIAPF
jgi:TPR repeat protein